MSERTASASATCSNCGAQLNPGAKYCNKCGQKVPSSVKPLVCPECGELINEETKFCRKCGAKIIPVITETGNPVSPVRAEPEDSKKDNSKRIIWILTSVIGVLAVVIAFLLGRGSNASSADPVLSNSGSEIQNTEEAVFEPVEATDLTGALDDIDKMLYVLPAKGGYETEEYANWWYSGSDNYSYARYNRSDKVDYFWSKEIGHSLFNVVIGNPVELSGLSDWDCIESDPGQATFHQDNMNLTICSETYDNREIVTEIEFIRDRETETVSAEADYFFPDSLDVLLDESQLYGLSAKELTLARNEVYARYGYTFQRQELQEYFNTKSWYHADPAVNKDTISSYVSAIGMQNMIMIREYQKAHGLTY